MHIKQVIIQGFKSYRDQTIVGPFHEGHNVVVGRNGSGKSNFFYAIQFVLSDEFVHLRPEQRQSLLHEGSGPGVISAYVEIIFDNKDFRIPIKENEVTLRRVIGSNKDQYFLNKKLVIRTEVMNLLESAGFSNSNPYYIVKQGKIHEMSTAPDSHRLKLLREVAGTRVYDERRGESLQLLKEVEGTGEQIENFIETVGERLGKLEEEKEELKRYQKLDKTRRSLEHIIYDNELKETRNKLANFEKKRNEAGSKHEKMASDLNKLQAGIKTLGWTLKETKKQLNSLKLERDCLNYDEQQLLKEIAKLEYKINDLTEEVQGDDKSKERAERELARLAQSIEEKQARLEDVRPQYEAMRKREAAVTRELEMKEQRRKELYAKQNRVAMFTSKDDRDKWIQNELRSLKTQLKNKRDHKNKLEADLGRDITKTVELKRQVEEKTQELERQKDQIDRHSRQYDELKKNKYQHQPTRNELWQKENTAQQNLLTLKETLANADHKLRSIVGQHILNGRDSVLKVLDTFRSLGRPEADQIVNSYYGTLIDNLKCDNAIYTAVEVTAGNRLFYHVVESAAVGSAILKEINRQKLPGEVSFMPLDKLNVREFTYPNSEVAIPMISRLNYDPKYDKAMRFVFGNTLLCRSTDVATASAKFSRLNCVTLEGDQVSSKGDITGGYYNKNRSRLQWQKLRTDTVRSIAVCETSIRDLNEELKRVDSDVDNVMSEMQKAEIKRNKAKDIYDKLEGELRLIKEELSNIDRVRSSKERSLSQCTSALDVLQSSVTALESELHQELMSQLSSQDQAEVDSLNDDIQRLQKDNKEAFSARMQLEAEKSKLENLIANNLMRRKDEILHALQEISLEHRRRQLEMSTTELEEIKRRINGVNEDRQSIERKLGELGRKLEEEQEEMDGRRRMEKGAKERLEEAAKLLDKYATEQNLLEAKIAESEEKISQLGPLPTGDFYSRYKQKDLFKELKNTIGQLKKFCHVNQKAIDQFLNLSEQRVSWRRRKDEQDRGSAKIQELLAVLEERKNEAIQFTFRQVAKFFPEVFRRLVPAGKASLVVRTVGNEDDLDIDTPGLNVDDFTGIGIKVSFTGGNARMKEMNQLSGGQKSMVALALIFAIQKCDPAPFYLFDEIDQALDVEHRTAVASMIRDLSEEAQFITTTFKPEFLAHADKFWGVKCGNKVSHVECVSKEDARNFVEDDPSHE